MNRDPFFLFAFGTGPLQVFLVSNLGPAPGLLVRSAGIEAEDNLNAVNQFFSVKSSCEATVSRLSKAWEARASIRSGEPLIHSRHSG